jgi:hypothetical protein
MRYGMPTTGFTRAPESYLRRRTQARHLARLQAFGVTRSTSSTHHCLWELLFWRLGVRRLAAAASLQERVNMCLLRASTLLDRPRQ